MLSQGTEFTMGGRLSSELAGSKDRHLQRVASI